ncbi:hypothetical protein D3C75_1086970 [compost metagenome]
MLRRGSAASAAVIPTISSPPNENMITAIAITNPSMPCGIKPPCSHRLLILACGPPLPLAKSQAPKTIMPTIATTLIMANQNSVSPYSRTLTRLIRFIRTKNTAAETQVGMSGHQY